MSTDRRVEQILDSSEAFIMPFIRSVKRQIEHLLQVVDLEFAGQRVQIDGFRLRNLDHWAWPVVGSLLTNMGSLSSFCDCDCEFCYERNTPFQYERGMLSMEEVETRIRYFSIQEQRGLPLSKRPYLEPFCNPQAIAIWRRVRQEDPTLCLAFVTNGAFLTEEVVAELAELKPIFAFVSLNTIDAELRKQTMRMRQSAQVTIDAIPLLKRYGIQYLGSIVAWPSYSLSQIEEAVRYLDRHDSVVIRIYLPGYNRYNSAGASFDTREQWDRVVALGRRLRQEVDTPIQIQPSLYWLEGLKAEVDGVIRNSPAARAGVRAGDVILTVDGQPVLNRPQAGNLLRFNSGRNGDQPCHEIQVRRGNKTLQLTLAKEGDDEDLYPYKPYGYPEGYGDRLGLFFVDDFRLGVLARLKQVIEEHAAHRVLVLSSHLVKPLIDKALALMGHCDEYWQTLELYVEVPEHRFWGGNIIIGDLYQVSDYIAHVKEFIHREGFHPDLIVVPSTFADNWGLDLQNRSYLEIEHLFDIPTVLLFCPRMVE